MPVGGDDLFTQPSRARCAEADRVSPTSFKPIKRARPHAGVMALRRLAVPEIGLSRRFCGDACSHVSARCAKRPSFVKVFLDAGFTLAAHTCVIFGNNTKKLCLLVWACFSCRRSFFFALLSFVFSFPSVSNKDVCPSASSFIDTHGISHKF